jgi:D-mannonate dehydratase
VREALSSLPPEEASLAQAESLLRALSVTDEGALQTLLTYFMRDVVVEEPSTEEAEVHTHMRPDTARED